MTTDCAPIPRAEQTAVLAYPVSWRRWCGAPPWHYNLTDSAEQRASVERVVLAHRAEHRKAGRP